MRITTLLMAATLIDPTSARAQTLGAMTVAADSIGVVRAVDAFHAKLAAADSTGVMALLAPHAVVLEAGAFESREEYHTHHLAADIAFAAAVPSVRTVRRVEVRGDMAWVASTSETKGTFKDRAINSTGAELVILTRRDGHWLIASIHWSSRSRRTS